MDLKKLKNKQFFASLASIFLSFCLLLSTSVSCNIFKGIGSEETASPEVTATSIVEEETVAEPEQKIEINIWENIEPREQIALLDSIEAFMGKNPDISINSSHKRSKDELIDQFIASSLAGSGPEIIVTSIESGKTLAAANVLKELPGVLYNYEIIDGLREIASFEGKEYVIPFRAFDLLMIYYNKDLVPEVPLSFDELIAYCKEVNNPAEDIWGFLLNVKEPDWVIPFVGGYQGWIFDYDTNSITLDTPAMQRTLEFLLLLYNEEQILPYDIEYADIESAFIEGRAHMIINGNWASEQYTEAGLNYGVAKIPVPVQGFRSPTPMVDGVGFMINANCFGKELDASNRFIDYMMSEDVQATWIQATQTLPSLENIDQFPAIESDQISYSMIQQLKISRGKPSDEYIRFIRDAIRLNLENVILENIPPEEAIVKMQEDAILLKTGKLEIQDETGETVNSGEGQ